MADTDTLARLISRRAAEAPDGVYLEDARSDRTITYADLAAATAAWSGRLAERGVPGGAPVVVDIGDPLDFALTHLSVVASGRRSVPTNPDLSDDDLARIVALLDREPLLVTDRDDRALAVPTVRIGALPDAAASAPAGRGSVLLFTSGSTGEPKGVELPEQQLLFVARGISEHNALTAEDRGYNPLPLFHVNAEVVGLLATLVAGATLVLDRRFHRTGFWELLAERRITWLNAVPAMLAVLARGGEFVVPERLRFVRSASAPLPDAVRAALGSVPLVVSWGMTEGASQITATPLDQAAREGSVGLPIGCEVQVRDADGAPQPADTVGALWVRGPGIVTQYWGGRAADRFDDAGWLSTGDMGMIDAEGWVTLVGRSDDVINRGGEKVYPAEVEEVLLGDPRVQEAIVVGRQHPILHQVPVAYVIPIDGADAADLVTSLTARAESSLPRFKRPIEITVVDDVPRAPTGKIQRARVRAMADGE